MNAKQKTLVLTLVLIITLGIFYVVHEKRMDEPEYMACTMEAKICPDGSYVGRQGPQCQFAECPGKIEGVWKTKTDNTAGVSFQYPENITTTYIHTVDWPPQVQILNTGFTCTEAGSETARAGITERKIINGREYCVTRESEGAAGSIYTQYAYAFAKGIRTAILTFTTRTVQCANYNEPEKTACLNEQETFNVNGIADRMAQSLQLF